MKRSLMILRAVVVLACIVGIIMIVQFGKKAGLFGRPRIPPPPDYSALMKIDPELMIYEELEPMPFEMENATGLAVGRDGKIYVCGEKLIVLDLDGKQMSEIALESPAYSVTADEEGVIYLCVGDHVEVYEKTGEMRAAWDSAGKDAVLGTALVKGDTVYVSDVGSHALLWYDKDGEIQGRDNDYVVFGSRNIGLTLDHTGALWAVNPGRLGLRKYGKEMEPVTELRRPGRPIDRFSGCCNPQHVVARKDGALVTSEKNVIRVKVLDQQGELVGVVAGPEELKDMEKAPPIAVTPDDRVLILDAGKKLVRVFGEKSV
ncbi:hypothetical protein ACFLQU_00455 [Verrucomicrobiota bacterium]